MEEALQRFVDWFIKFAIVSAVLLIGTHLLARSLRKKKSTSQEKLKSKSDSDQTQE
jgi:hypothetical protein